MLAKEMEVDLWFVKLMAFHNWLALFLGELDVVNKMCLEFMSKCPTMKSGFKTNFLEEANYFSQNTSILNLFLP